MRRDRGVVKQAETINLSKVCNTSFVLVRRGSTFLDTKKVLVNYAVDFDFEYGIKFFNARIKYIVNDTLSSLYLPTRIRAAYVRYIQFSKLCVNDSALFPELER